MKKNVIFGIVIAVLLIALAICGLGYCNRQSTSDEAQQEQLAQLQAQKSAAALRADSLQKALNECLGILSPEDSLKLQIKNLEKEVASLKKRPAPAPKKQDVVVATFDETFKRSQPTVQQRSVEQFAPADTRLPITDFEGDLSGQFGTTVNEKGNLVYYVSQALINRYGGNGAPRLNGQSGPQFSYNQTTGYWTLVDNRLISAEQINSPAHEIRWNVYIGQVQHNLGSYPAFLPHESLKALIVKARGQEYGEITAEDLKLMAQENDMIAQGLIKPLRINSNPGRNNENFWHGWDFVTQIFARTKTMIN